MKVLIDTLFTHFVVFSDDLPPNWCEIRVDEEIRSAPVPERQSRENRSATSASFSQFVLFRFVSSEPPSNCLIYATGVKGRGKE